MNTRTLLPLSLLCAAALAAPALARAADKVDFKKDVQPILKESCVKCHGLDPAKPNKKAAAKLRLDDKDAAMKGGKDGAAIIAGKAKDSLLYKLLLGPVKAPDEDGDNDREIDPMPKVKRGETFKPLPQDQIETLRRWIDEGASWSS